MSTIVSIAEIPHGRNMPTSIAECDAWFLQRALVKRWPGRVFTVVMERGGVAVEFVSEAGPVTTGDMAREMKVFAEGFMASAHLWER